jgi:hypothetical protein
MDPFILTVPAGGGRSKNLAHEGEEFLRVLAGKVQFHYGDGVHELAAGDSLYFDAATPHRLVNPGSKDAQVLCVFHGRGRPLMAKPRKRRRPATSRGGPVGRVGRGAGAGYPAGLDPAGVEPNRARLGVTHARPDASRPDPSRGGRLGRHHG